MNDVIPDLVKDSFDNIPVIDKDGYQYFIHPLSDGIRFIDPDLLGSFVDMVMDAMSNMPSPSLLVTAEAMGIPITATVSTGLKIPFSIARKRPYHLEGEIEVVQRTGYSSQSLFFNLPRGPGKVIIIDDVLSTGGTLKALAEGTKRSDMDVDGAIVLFNKMGDRTRKLSEQLGFPILTLLDVFISKGKCRICMSCR